MGKQPTGKPERVPSLTVEVLARLVCQSKVQYYEGALVGPEGIKPDDNCLEKKIGCARRRQVN